MKIGTIEDLMEDFKNIANRKNFTMPYHLQERIRQIAHLFGSAGDAYEWFSQYRRDRHWKEEP